MKKILLCLLSFYFSIHSFYIPVEKLFLEDQNQATLIDVHVSSFRGGTIFNKKNQYYFSQRNFPMPEWDRRYDYFVSDLDKKKPTIFISKAFYLCPPHSTVYYHWILEILPKIIKNKDYLLKEDIILIFEGYAKHKKYIQETLSIIGLTREKYIFLDQRYNYHFKELTIPKFDGFWPTKNDILLVRNFFISKLLLDDKSMHQKNCILISRNCRARKIINESNFLEILKQRFAGYYIQKFNGERMSFMEQVLQFYQASVIVGAHGSGMVNQIFCKKLEYLVEFVPFTLPKDVVIDLSMYHRIFSILLYGCYRVKKVVGDFYSEIYLNVSGSDL